MEHRGFEPLTSTLPVCKKSRVYAALRKGSRKNLLLPAAPLPLNKVRETRRTEEKGQGKEEKRKAKERRAVVSGSFLVGVVLVW